MQRLNTTSLVLLVSSSLLLSCRGGGPFEDRRRMMLDAVWEDYQKNPGKPSARQAFWRASALFELGKTVEGRVLANRGLDILAPGNRENRWIYGGNTNFDAWPGVDCYIRHEKHLDAATQRRFREIYAGGAFYRQMSTSNHKIMAAVCRYLATQIWGEDAFKAHPFYASERVRKSNPGFSVEDAMRFDKNDPTGEKYIRRIIDQMVRSGPGEYASRPYGAANILPILSIAECAADPELRRSAAMAYEVVILQLAPAWLRGHLATFSPRSYPDMEIQRPWGVATLLWAHFGGVRPDRLHEQAALRLATSGHRLPPFFQAAGTERAKPYVYRSLINRWALYHFVNKDYVLFSRSPKAGDGQFQGQSYPCGVMWEEPDFSKGSHLWITCPAADEAGKMGIHTHGTSRHEQETQHRDALLFTFNIPSSHRYSYALGYIPGGYRASIVTANHIFLHYGTVLIAISSSEPIVWDPAGGIRAPASPPREGDSEFRVMKTKAALAIETALPEEFRANTAESGLAAFRDAIMANTRIMLRTGKSPAGFYQDRKGNTLECEFDGHDRINGGIIDYTRWPVLESPWTRQQRPEDPLVVTDGNRAVTYDFGKWIVR